MARCASCGQPKAKHVWEFKVCAMDKQRRRSKRLCRSCDIAWNGATLAFFNHPDREKLMRKYRKSNP